MDTSWIKKLLITASAAGALFMGSSLLTPQAAHADERGWHGDHDQWRDHGREGRDYRWHGDHDDWRGHRGGGPGFYGPHFYGGGRMMRPGYYDRGYYHRGPSVIIAP